MLDQKAASRPRLLAVRGCLDEIFTKPRQSSQRAGRADIVVARARNAAKAPQGSSDRCRCRCSYLSDLQQQTCGYPAGGRAPQCSNSPTCSCAQQLARGGPNGTHRQEIAGDKIPASPSWRRNLKRLCHPQATRRVLLILSGRRDTKLARRYNPVSFNAVPALARLPVLSRSTKKYRPGRRRCTTATGSPRHSFSDRSSPHFY